MFGKTKKELAELRRRVEALEKCTQILKDADAVMVFEKPISINPKQSNESVVKDHRDEI